jgi:hypothetical protein
MSKQYASHPVGQMQGMLDGLLNNHSQDMTPQQQQQLQGYQQHLSQNADYYAQNPNQMQGVFNGIISAAAPYILNYGINALINRGLGGNASGGNYMPTGGGNSGNYMPATGGNSGNYMPTGGSYPSGGMGGLGGLISGALPGIISGLSGSQGSQGGQGGLDLGGLAGDLGGLFGGSQGGGGVIGGGSQGSGSGEPPLQGGNQTTL